jgi:cytochrome b561
MNTNRSWNAVARGLHWLMAVLILLQGLVGWIAQEMERSPGRVDAMTFHKSLGLTLLLLLLLRLAWRWTHPVPPPPGGSSTREIRLARLTHFALYLLVGAIALSGWVAASAYVVPWKLWWLMRMPRIVAPDKATYDLASGVHDALVAVFLAILAVHVAAALWHHFVKHDRVLIAMWRGER